MPAFCRDCLTIDPAGPACPGCGGGRIVRHPELFALTVAHVDCDAFYASVEKRDRPDLAARPVIVGGGVRGVVTAACYIARLSGVRSAMPMFKALKACPDAVVIRPDFAKYTAASRALRTMMTRLTPLVEALSIDEAALDLRGTDRVHGAPPALVLARFAADVQRQLGITVSVGLAPNRLLAKVAAGRDKPRGFAVIGAAEARGLLAGEPVGLLPGIGPAMVRRLADRGITLLGQLQAMDERAALRLGPDGPALRARACGEDVRRVNPVRAAKSISAETTLDSDVSRVEDLEPALWRVSEKLARRLREARLCTGDVTLKLKTAAFVSHTRAVRLSSPTALPDRLFEAGRAMLANECDGTRFRLIGLGTNRLLPIEEADRGDLADSRTPRLAAAHAAVEKLRARYGEAVIGRGRGLR